MIDMIDELAVPKVLLSPVDQQISVDAEKK